MCLARPAAACGSAAAGWRRDGLCRPRCAATARAAKRPSRLRLRPPHSSFGRNLTSPATRPGSPAQDHPLTAVLLHFPPAFFLLCPHSPRRGRPAPWHSSLPPPATAPAPCYGTRGRGAPGGQRGLTSAVGSAGPGSKAKSERVGTRRDTESHRGGRTASRGEERGEGTRRVKERGEGSRRVKERGEGSRRVKERGGKGRPR